MHEARWIVITNDGHHAWLGRDSNPTVEELDALTLQLNAKGIVGWVAVLKGDYWARRSALEIILVRLLTEQAGDWESALQSWRGRRENALRDAS